MGKKMKKIEDEIELIFGRDKNGNEIKRSAYTNNADIKNASKLAERINSEIDFDGVIEEIDMSVGMDNLKKEEKKAKNRNKIIR